MGPGSEHFSARAAACGLTVLAQETRREGVHSRWARWLGGIWAGSVT